MLEELIIIIIIIEEEIKQLIIDLILIVVFEMLLLIVLISLLMILVFILDVILEFIGVISESISFGIIQDREIIVFIDLLFVCCRGYQCFFNRICIDILYGRIKCKCMKVDLVFFYIVNCMFVDFLLIIVVFSVGLSLLFQIFIFLVDIFGIIDSILIIIQILLSIVRFIYLFLFFIIVVVIILEFFYIGNNLVIFSGKIFDKDILVVKEVIINVIKNMIKGKYLYFFRYCQVILKQIKGMLK